MRWLTVLIALCATLHFISGGSLTDAQESLLVGRIVYSHEGDIYLMNADGSDALRLTTDPAEDFDPAWSPDGTKIAFRSHRDGEPEVYVMNADGTEQVSLTQNPASDYSPAWSSDGTKIAFASNRDGDPNEIYVMNADGSEPTRITDNPGIDEYPTWSPDGTRLAFHCTFGHRLANGTGDFEICVINADGTGLIQLTDTPGENKLPTWSPDGTQIAFQSNRDGWPSLPDYLPPGYDPQRFGDFDVWVMNADGTDQHNLTNNPREDESFPSWSRSGNIIFSRYGCIAAITPDGTGERAISTAGCTYFNAGNFADWYVPQEAITGTQTLP